MDLINAASNGDIATVKKLIEAGANPNEGDYDFRRPLHLAAAGGHLETVKYLVEHAKVDVNVLDRWNSTPLADAMRYKFYDVASYLRKHGGMVIGNSDNSKAIELLKAVSENDMPKVEALLAEGVDVNACDENGRTALHHAAANGNVNLADLLIKHGAQCYLADRWGNTPYTVASDKKDDAMVKLLEQYGARNEDVEAFIKTRSFQYALTKILNLLTEKSRWTYATAYTQSDDKTFRSVGWSGDNESLVALATFRKSVESAEIPVSNDNWITQVWNTRNPVWVEDTNTQSDREPSALHDFIKSIGFKTLFLTPVAYQGRMIAVLEFRSTEARPESEDVKNYSATIAARMIAGSFVDGSGALGVQFADQLNAVYRILLQESMFSEGVIRKEVHWFYNCLGLNDFYFQHHPPEQIAKHIRAFIAAKLHAQATGRSEDIEFSSENSEGAVFIVPATKAPQIEQIIEAKYFKEGKAPSSEASPLPAGMATSLKVFYSKGPASPGGNVKLAIYILLPSPFVNPTPGNTSDVWQVASAKFLKEKAVGSRNRYAHVVEAASNTLAPVIEVEKSTTTSEDIVVTVAYPTGSTHSFFSSISRVLSRYNIECVRKYIEVFSNNITVYSLHLRGITVESAGPLVESLNLLWVLPRTSVFPLFEDGILSLEEVMYAHAAKTFAFHFVTSKSDEFLAVWDAVKDVETRAKLSKLQKRMRSDLATESRITETIFEYTDIIKDLYADFQEHFKPRPNGEMPPKPTFNKDIWSKVKKNVVNNVDLEVLRSFLTFNASILKTNFFSPKKVALSFRLDPSFLKDDVPVVPYGMFLMIGSEFRGLHIRFDDVARGGIRLIRSRNQQAWQRNAETLFDENYNLAFTQQKKNKDIPEAGSKGTVLLAADSQEKGKSGFCKYIDAMLDLLLPSKEVVDHYGQPEYIFCGPDEGTADVMQWAALHAKSRGYSYWSAFTTGKPPSMGGIPHDLYGMTTGGVHEYVLGVLRKLNLDETKITKFQTGGPDGDLGSNEIKISKDITIGIVDGSGVLYDPHGIDREELLRLANARKMVINFDRSKLSKDGFFVSIDDKDVTLPNGEVVESGLNFRNNFHLNPLARADLFVPCGGRPEAVNISNVHKLLRDGKPMFKYIIEGANLFFTQEARAVLESAGVVLYKDASANKGGVTSSSLEVLAALCLTPEEFDKHMCVKDGVVPEFYQAYVKDVKARIAENARAEFECLWNEAEKTGMKRSVLTDVLSERINQLNTKIRQSGLFDSRELRLKIAKEVLPKTLQDLLGAEEILRRLPENYQVALLSAHLASKYIYENGTSASEFTFYQFMQRYN